ncbi:MAG: type 4a pilus biogenesis protein PilO [Sedimentisphaerales bacterium]
MFFEKKQIVIIAVATAAFSGFILFRYIPLSRSISAVKSARAEQNMIIAKGISDAEQLKVFTDQLNKLKEKLDNYEAKLPGQKDLGLFLKQIAGLMDGHNLSNQAIQPLEEVRTSQLICIPISMECTGSLTNLFEFYGNLQSLDRAIRINQVKLKNGTDFSGEVRMSTQIVIYYRTQAG